MGAKRLWWRSEPSSKLIYGMSRVNRERRAAETAPLGNGSGEQFLERRRHHRYAQMHESWIAFPNAEVENWCAQVLRATGGSQKPQALVVRVAPPSQVVPMAGFGFLVPRRTSEVVSR